MLIYTENEKLNRELNKRIRDSRIVYYPEYILKEQKVTTLVISIQNDKFDFKSYMFEIRKRNVQVILLLENENVKELKDAIILGIYDIIFNPFSLEEIIKKVNKSSVFSDIAKYIEDFL